MNKYLFAILGIIICGCTPSYDFTNKGNLTIYSKEIYSDLNSKYTIRGTRVVGRIQREQISDLIIYMPKNFGEVGNIITITNGIRAWGKENKE